MMAAPEIDVAVVGGGPAGAATALALARAGLRAALIDASGPGDFRIGETVPPDLRSVLRELGAWESFAADSHLPSAGNASAWGSAELLYRDALFDVRGPGWHLDRRRFDATLTAEAARAGARIWTRTRVAGWQRRDGAWSLTLRGPDAPERLDATFLVDATGRAAAVARRCGARRVSHDRLVAVYALFAWPEHAPGDLHTLVEAAEDGWWYAARLPGDRAVATWMSDGDLVQAAGLRSPDSLGNSGPWMERLARTRHVRRLLAGASPASRLAVRSAVSCCLDRAVGEGWIAVGDAACAFDPLSSAGIVAGLRSGLAAAGALARHLAGDGTALAGWDGRLRRGFTDYLNGWREQYRLETRWPGSPFWRRRREKDFSLQKGDCNGQMENQTGPVPARSPARGAASRDPLGAVSGMVAEPGVLGAGGHRPGQAAAG